MPNDTITLDIYVVVDEDGDYGIATTDFDDARTDYDNNYGGYVAAQYKIGFVIPRPQAAKEVTITAKLRDEPRGVPDAFGNVFAVEVTEPD